jgi:hypothetical protein
MFTLILDDFREAFENVATQVVAGITCCATFNDK